MTFVDHYTPKQQIHIYFKCTWNGHQDQSYVGPQNSLSRFQKTEILQSIFSDHNRIKIEQN